MQKEYIRFIHPENDNVKIWRYMDFAKFVSLLDNSSLYFSRSDVLGDPFEGTLPNRTIETVKTRFTVGGIAHEIERMFNLTKEAKSTTFINCWSIGQHESAAMWKLYVKNDYGIAIESTFSQLSKVLIKTNYSIYTGKVCYIDYENDEIEFGDMFQPFLIKRTSYAHENEIRNLIWVNESTNKSIILQPFSKGFNIKIDLANLINSVHISADSQEWFKDLVKSLLIKNNLNINVFKSRLNDVPKI